MSKWLSVCIFLLLAIACTVDVEPVAPVEGIAPAAPVALAEAVAPTAPAAPVTTLHSATPRAQTWDEQTNAVGGGGASGNMPRISVTRGWSQPARHASAP